MQFEYGGLAWKGWPAFFMKRVSKWDCLPVNKNGRHPNKLKQNGGIQHEEAVHDRREERPEVCRPRGSPRWSIAVIVRLASRPGARRRRSTPRPAPTIPSVRRGGRRGRCRPAWWRRRWSGSAWRAGSGGRRRRWRRPRCKADNGERGKTFSPLLLFQLANT